MSSTKWGSILTFASCVIHRPLVFAYFLFAPLMEGFDSSGRIRNHTSHPPREVALLPRTSERHGHAVWSICRLFVIVPLGGTYPIQRGGGIQRGDYRLPWPRRTDYQGTVLHHPTILRGLTLRRGGVMSARSYCHPLRNRVLRLLDWDFTGNQKFESQFTS